MKSILIASIVVFGILLAVPVFADINTPFVLTVPQNLTGGAGSLLEFKVQITNPLLDQNLTNISISVSGISGDIAISPQIVSLLSNETKDINVSISVPPYLSGDYQIFVQAETPRKFALKIIDLTVKGAEVSKVKIEYFVQPDVIEADKDFNFGVIVTNSEPEPQTVNLKLSVPETWAVFPNESQISIDSGETKFAYFIITPSSDEGEIMAVATYEKGGNTFQSDLSTGIYMPQQAVSPIIPTGLFALALEDPLVLTVIILALLTAIVILLRIGLGMRSKEKKK